MLKHKLGFKNKVLILILISFIIRAFIAAFIELGNDEVYYWTYALFPDLSHFDHPPMVGFVIQIFSLNLLFDSEIFIRLAALVFGSINTWLIYSITYKLKDEKAGFIAALLFTSSIYCFIISGTFILPDAPQTFFWLLSLNSLLIIVNEKFNLKLRKSHLIYLGVWIGLGMLSKYTSVFLWAGFGSFIIFYQREWLKTKEFYISLIISILIFLPVILWNLQNDFISFTFQAERVEVSNYSLRFDYFGTELAGQVLYNNPVVFIIILLALISVFRKKMSISIPEKRIILLISLPLIIVFLGFSLFRSTLPHWTGPAYMSLIPGGAIYLYERKANKVFSGILITSLIILFLALALGFGQIKSGFLLLDQNTEITNKGRNDFSLDLYGWEQLGEQFARSYRSDLAQGIIDDQVVIVSNRWFPAAHLDYYVASPLRIKVMGIGSLERIHKYQWINEKRGGFKPGMDAYFIALSTDYFDPNKLYSEYFSSIEFVESIPIIRGKEIVKFALVYRMMDYKK